MRAARSAERAQPFVLAALAVLTLASWLFLTVVHVDDRYRVGHGQGVWMALAQDASDGVLYRPIYDGERFGGTRYMPLQVGIYALGGELTGEYLTSGKLIAFLTTSALLAVVFRRLRREGCSAALAAALTMLIIATEGGLHAGTTLGGDVLPALLQVGMIALVAGGPEDRRARAVAAILGALALLTKFTAVWGVLAVITWFLVNGRRRDAGRFAITYLAAAIALLGAAELLSGGRMSENILGLALSGGVGLKALGRAPNQLLTNLGDLTLAAWFLVPLALVAILSARSWRSVTVTQWALAWSSLTTLAVLSDIGTGYNQMVDLTALLVLVVGAFAATVLREDRERDPIQATVLIPLMIAWALGTGLALTVLPDVKEAVSQSGSGSSRPLLGTVRPGETLLSEDPGIPVGLERTPVILDPFMLPRLAPSHPAATEDLIARIDAREWDVIALIERAEGNDVWWRDYHLGPGVIDAIRRNYAFDREVDGFFVYRPR
jgi:hypothetical protein